MEIRIEERINSCKIAINAKGLFSGEVKVYDETIEKAFEKAKQNANDLERYIKGKNIERQE